MFSIILLDYRRKETLSWTY